LGFDLKTVKKKSLRTLTAFIAVNTTFITVRFRTDIFFSAKIFVRLQRKNVGNSL